MCPTVGLFSILFFILWPMFIYHLTVYKKSFDLTPNFSLAYLFIMFLQAWYLIVFGNEMMPTNDLTFF